MIYYAEATKTEMAQTNHKSNKSKLDNRRKLTALKKNNFMGQIAATRPHNPIKMSPLIKSHCRLPFDPNRCQFERRTTPKIENAVEPVPHRPLSLHF